MRSLLFTSLILIGQYVAVPTESSRSLETTIDAEPAWTSSGEASSSNLLSSTELAYNYVTQGPHKSVFEIEPVDESPVELLSDNPHRNYGVELTPGTHHRHTHIVDIPSLDSHENWARGGPSAEHPRTSKPRRGDHHRPIGTERERGIGRHNLRTTGGEEGGATDRYRAIIEYVKEQDLSGTILFFVIAIIAPWLAADEWSQCHWGHTFRHLFDPNHKPH
ncbi:hypothetical protein PTTG_11974 [Puccinia triticina 1-1 BBBD Race 1]|uniref:Uncharacterized protein n=2 Tax=Puccinia triticina TaxID=208348 RepID=A0A180GKI2_PUCT1|nr:uncharacterized protein PtA15_1A902 [Puccinia triticina]OAV93054.1 hypothetical protein PTTG_11974 [Puccinia triticina 1-1 BBBD Race 1]WAQ81560.1 hypothetical protein PtA15_1A902 [Puccinia triticina]WAR52445.1 hypothetical protein PtB15_1B887 [Puccinia triticina]